MKPLATLFDNNRAWAEDIKAQSPSFFHKLAAQQAPAYLWIGCSDSRVPANEIVGLLPGELFVHRNVGNIVVHSDMNCLSVLQYALDVLHVKHVIVCGHYGCGGVKAAMEEQPHGLVDNWLRHIGDIQRRSAAELAVLPTDAARVDRLCELNIIEQVANVARTTVARDVWARGQEFSVHGWIYSIADGLIRDLGVSCCAPVVD